MLKANLDQKINAGGGGTCVIEAQGSIMEITSDIAQLINAIHTQFNQSEPVLAEMFKSVLSDLITSPETPLWTPQGEAIGVCISRPKN